jgi:hypothetical protein
MEKTDQERVEGIILLTHELLEEHYARADCKSAEA